MSEKKKKRMTTAFGVPVGDDQNSMTAGERGPVLMQDVHLLEKISHFDRERIPERVVHAKGAGAGGYFEVTNDVSKYTKASFLSEIGKKTEVFARFSTVGGEKGSADADRDRENLVGNIVEHLSVAQKRIQLRQAAIFFKADKDYGRKIAEGLKLDVNDIEKLAKCRKKKERKLLRSNYLRKQKH